MPERHLHVSGESRTPKLCYAPPDRIPHAPHDWFDWVWMGELMWAEWHHHCDGWVAALPSMIEGVRRGMGYADRDVSQDERRDLDRLHDTHG